MFMPQLYTCYADLYPKGHQSFIDFDEEYQFDKALLIKYDVNSILEIGCGTGEPLQNSSPVIVCVIATGFFAPRIASHNPRSG
jgi:hypothetical protein